MLVQVVKEERGNKGAALTTYLSLAGRYCVLMPNTARGGGISRKITNAADRKKLKEIAKESTCRRAWADHPHRRRQAHQDRDQARLRIPAAPVGAGARTDAQIHRAALIYEEGDLIKRSIRDLYNKEIDEVLVEGEEGYRVAKDFMKMIMPSHAKNVKHYKDDAAVRPLPGRELSRGCSTRWCS
jgi:ribonuclease E